MLATRWRKICDQLPDRIHLLAVSKGNSSSSIRQLAALGQRDFGESRLQEALPKLTELSDLEQVRWHFIGRLQSNKVRAVVKAFPVIHSLDSEKLALRLSRIAGEEKLYPEVMLQVKFRDDPTKGGFTPAELLEAWPRLCELPNLKLGGLMAMPPIGLSIEGKRELFTECRHLSDQLGLRDCSMGMSDDWQAAVESGATWIRLGSILFGSRYKGHQFLKDRTKTV